ncbi:LigB subunit of an aromatic-ring-opening dioxygenase LigAB [Aaosphaeria arxii CBS 175.79]|uniref:LigB subunit of an aromatic-ring-opening dioxygenase LigAB n=1 Tax=Aaosphaeria arxii CBS 175.79 TaxID=1450172 RepID=A0A6A5Y798_9PLEO|nr:LigB subunit of an aromatic-ring-opening dioxygenase LigAB [Aaosphaeria arxii CBS 175.79]KAF2021432.1 LigB subunit of an aromatic-ring-opening dioxygenase LigAB [Aaosphaeria arxii CBS 175.79]
MVPTPVHFFSHGSTMMLGEESKSATYWKQCGDEALANGIKGIVMMGAHWDARGHNRIDISMNPTPSKSPVAYVHPSKYASYELNPDLPTGKRCVQMLQDAGINAKPNETFDWIHDTYLILIRMFPEKCPPTTIVSMNGRFDPHLHARVGSILAPLRQEGYLLIGTGGSVHNLYRNHWLQMLRYSDNFAQPVPPDAPMLLFRQGVEDAFVRNCGAGREKGSLTRAVCRMMKHPQYRIAHGTDDHFMPACFVAGVVDGLDSDGSDDGECVLGAEDWELVNMCNSQFTIGKWVKA